MDDLTEQARLRRGKLARLQEGGRDPFAHTRFDRTHLAADLQARFDELEGQEVAACGRLMRRNELGKLCFADLVDGSGRVQLSVRRDVVGEEAMAEFLDLDLGDIIGVCGKLFRTRRGEVTVEVARCTLLAKTLRPLPEKYHGLTNPEVRYRQRYLDFLVTPEARAMITRRAAMLAAARRVLDGKGFVEVDTPVLQPLYGGAAARPFTTHHNALDLDLYLRIAPELYLKRLVVGNLERVYEVARCFRNEGISPRHNPEFTQIEAYMAYADYHDMMDLVEELICAMAEAVVGGLQFQCRGETVDLTPPWRRVPLLEAIKEACGVDFAAFETDEAARAACAGLGLGAEEGAAGAGAPSVGQVARPAGSPDAGLATRATGGPTWGELLDKAFDKYVKDRTVQPTFVVDYPVRISPLAKRRADDPTLAQRFEPVLGREELGNAFSELNDPLDQRRRFEQQLAARQAGDEEAHPLDEDFLTALEYGLPPTGGLGIGIDRLLMLLTDADNLRETIAFPLLRPL